MPDETTTIARLKGCVRDFTDARDWEQYHSPRNVAMALSVEVAELLELFLWCADDGPQPPVASREPRVTEEVADVAICLLNFCNRMDIDLSSAVLSKLAAAEERYPVELARGRLEKSDEL